MSIKMLQSARKTTTQAELLSPGVQILHISLVTVADEVGPGSQTTFLHCKKTFLQHKRNYKLLSQ